MNVTDGVFVLLVFSSLTLGCASENHCGAMGNIPLASDGGVGASDGPPAAMASVTRFKIPLTPELPGTFGSGLAYDKTDDTYWMVTDRGNRTKEWMLRLVKVKLTDATAQVVAIIPITEKGVGVSGAELDPEDIAVAPDGTLWVCDEIKPYILHLGRTGEILERIEPPKRFLDRTEDRGFEGLTISSDGKTVYAMLQQGNQNETDKLNTLIAAYDIATKTFQEYTYRLDDYRTYDYPEEVKGNSHATGLAVAGSKELYVLERDNQSGGNARLKRVYRVAIPDSPPAVALPKTLVVDLYKLGYQKEKAEGIAVPEPGVLVVANDNDGDILMATELWRIKL